MPALRCTVCQVNWPDDEKKYFACPQCGDRTNFRNDERPIPATEADKIWNKRQFELYLKQNPDVKYDPSIDENAERTQRAIARAEAQHALEMIPVTKSEKPPP